jgi:hypothetical protein
MFLLLIYQFWYLEVLLVVSAKGKPFASTPLVFVATGLWTIQFLTLIVYTLTGTGFILKSFNSPKLSLSLSLCVELVSVLHSLLKSSVNPWEDGDACGKETAIWRKWTWCSDPIKRRPRTRTPRPRSPRPKTLSPVRLTKQGWRGRNSMKLGQTINTINRMNHCWWH